jgi:hypothetical protein
MPVDRRRLLQGLGASALAPWASGPVGAAARAARALAPALDDLTRRLTGRLLTPGETDFVAEVTPANTRFADVLPLAVALCQSAEDVSTRVRWCQEEGVPLAARGAGHNYAGN